MAATALPLHGTQQQALSLRIGPASSGSQTQTQSSPSLRRPVLRLRGELKAKDDRKIQWAEDVVDNEGLGRKSSKVCCIYHAPKPIDESSDESSSDSSSDNESGTDDGGARPVGHRRSENRARHDHNQGHGNGDTYRQDCGPRQGNRKKARTRSPNAYEKMPTAKEGSSGKAK